MTAGKVAREMLALADQRLSVSLARHKRNSKPVVDELRAYGLDITFIEDLYHKPFHYEFVVPVLLRWLPKAKHVEVKEAVVRALSVKWAKPAAAVPLIREFREAAEDSDSLKWAIGNALGVVADRSVLEDILDIAADARHGDSRQMIVMALWKFKDPRVVPLLISLLDEVDVALHAISSLKRLRAKEAMPRLEQLVAHPPEHPTIARQARIALARIEGATASSASTASRSRAPRSRSPRKRMAKKSSPP